MENKNKQVEIELFDSSEGEIHIEGGIHVEANDNVQFKSGNNIDKSKKYTLNIENMIMAWANPYNTEAVLYKRLPNINDRPMLEHYYKLFELKDDNLVSYKITSPMTFYAYVVTKRSKLNYAVINLIDGYGTKMAAHSIIKGCDLSKYLNKIIKFTGVIHPYDEDKEDGETKYGVTILQNKEIEIIEGKPHTLDKSPWDMLTEDNPNIYIEVEKLSSKFNKLDINTQMQMLLNIEDKLNTISFNMFNAPNLIYPIILTNFLMRDDIYDEKVLMYNQRHLNILMTIIVDYILRIRPNTFDELMKIIIYVILNYLGYDLNEPENKEKFHEFTDFMGIERSNADEYLSNAKQNAGGVQAILNYIPDEYKTKPGTIHEIATVQFVKRMIVEIEL